MFANFLIGLREGLEATLLVSILLAYLVKTGRTDARRPLWAGVALAAVLSLGFGAMLTFGTSELSDAAQEGFAGTLSVIAVGFVTWMIFWMKRTARDLRGDLHRRLDVAFGVDGRAIAVVAFLAVAREGLETALFIWASLRSAGSGPAPLSGAALGLGSAVALGWLFYRGAVHLDLAKFFLWTGAALVIVAAGVLANAVLDLQGAGLLPGAGSIAFDISGALPLESWYGSLVKGILNISAAPSWLAVAAWVMYVVPVMSAFLRVTSQPAALAQR
ncbi:MAG: iron uptake transporter permease EfeU [Candidatus Nanopelagicales bacterium]